MQNPSAMFDSTISKLLSAQQVEPPANIHQTPDPHAALLAASNLHHHNQQQHHLLLHHHLHPQQPSPQPQPQTNPDSPDATASPKSELLPSSNQAEVRLVVRFTVEEQIVYQGRVERINQLENQELTRVVSRVAWDSIKDIDNVKPVGNTCDRSTASDKETAHSEPANHVKQSTDPSTPTELPQQQHQQPVSAPESASKSPNPELSISSPATITSSETQVKEPPKTDHMIDKKTSTDLPTPTPTSQEQAPFVKPHSIEDTNHDLITDSLKQTQKQDSTTTSDSHTNSKEEPNTQTGPSPCDNPPSTSPPPPIQEPEKLANSLDEEVFHEAMEPASPQHPLTPTDEDTYIDNQSIYDTLNDCINNVARETLLAEKTVLSPTTPMIDTPISIDAESSRQNGSPYMRESSDDMTTIGRNSNESSRDTDLCGKIFLTDDLLHEEVTDISNKPSSTSSFASAETPEEVGLKNPPLKRKASSSDNSSGKRMKRGSLKNPRNSVTRKGTPKTYENVTNKDDATSIRPGSTMSLLVSNQQQIRQNKVFAKWSDNHFYPGVILKPAKDRKFVISFADGAQKDVSETDLIPLCNIVGKQVRVQIAKNYCYNAMVHDQRQSVNDEPMFEVEYQQDGLVKKCVSWKDIFLTGEQGIPLANQLDRNPGASNFADVDLDNIIYEKRSRRLQEMEEFYFTNSSPHRTKTSLLL